MIKTEVFIIGAGPAGISTAIQLKRFGIDFIICEKYEVGGLLANAYSINNYPGFPDGIKGGDMVTLHKKHLKNFEIQVVTDEVIEVNYLNKSFMITCQKEKYNSQFLVVASGTKPIEFMLSNSQINPDKLFYDIVSVNDKANKRFTIIGSGDAAFDCALSLARYNSSSDIFIRSSEAKALGILVKEAISNPLIKLHKSCELIKLVELNGELILTFKKGTDQIIHKSDYMIAAIGREPNRDFLSIEDEKLLFLMDAGKLLLAGDIINGNSRQSVISAGVGMKAAMDIYHKLNAKE